MKYIFTPTAEDDFDKLTQLNRKRIATKMRFYASQSDPLQFAEPLSGSNEYRFRIGDYRVIFEMLHDTLWVTAIKRRDEAYR
ncbi:MAG: type II toxin-antitoxin system RelE/ParE family toxin [Xanthobacteraceae bacterium]|jgi:mRNA-degrading endonuclease RelE of RelBE toxin-antitoxin system